MKTCKKNEFVKVLTINGFILDRYSGSHTIFKHEDGRTISIPRSMNSCIIQRLVKENKLVI